MLFAMRSTDCLSRHRSGARLAITTRMITAAHTSADSVLPPPRTDATEESSVRQQRLCVVTGGSSGIGAAVCSLFVAGGYKVLSAARRGAHTDNENIVGLQVDLTDEEGISKVVSAVRQQLGECAQAIICLVHAASNYPSDTAQEVDSAGLERALRLNVTLPAQLTAEMLPLMARGSCVIFVGSTLSEKAVPGKLSYCTAKHAMVGLMRATSQDLLGSGVRALMISPGITDTPMVREAVRGHEAAFGDFVRELQGRLLEPDEVARVIWDAAQSSAINGVVIHCHGGQRER